VLISGESGTGKELVARAVHAESNRRSGPFHAVNTGALTPELINSELFGHEKGSFTGASEKKRGFFEIAEGGTLFLDEIGTMQASTQVNLLRVIESKQFVRVGGTDSQQTDVRILAATNLDLLDSVRTGSFRRDLYYRLNVFALRLPPLRERKTDIPLLVEYFRQHYGSLYDCHVSGVEDEALRLLVDYDWPGNVRELSNVMTQLVIGAAGKKITPEEVAEALQESVSAKTVPAAGEPNASETVSHERRSAGDRRSAEQSGNEAGRSRSIDETEPTMEAVTRPSSDPPGNGDGHASNNNQPTTFRHPDPAFPAEPPAPAIAAAGGPVPAGDAFGIQAGQTIERVEEELIETTLRSVNGNRSKAARMLGISRKSLYNKIKAYNIEA
jgi:transcriptional regulator with PAS, ATPase and Fis domain